MILMPLLPLTLPEGGAFTGRKQQGIFESRWKVQEGLGVASEKLDQVGTVRPGEDSGHFSALEFAAFGLEGGPGLWAGQFRFLLTLQLWTEKINVLQ